MGAAQPWAKQPMIRRCLLAVMWVLLAGCAAGAAEAVTPMPANYPPTAAALTLAAQGIGAPRTTPAQPSSAALQASADSGSGAEGPTRPPGQGGSDEGAPGTGTPAGSTKSPPTRTAKPPATSRPTLTPTRTATATATPSATASLTPTPTATIDVAALSTSLALTAQAAQPFDPSAGTATFTPGPPVPEAPIQIYRLGEQSLVVSPIEVSAFIQADQARVARVELHGEDGRLLARYLRTSRVDGSGPLVRMGISLDFEISAAAEAGRLVFSLDDGFGRTIAVNSVDLTLLSLGSSQINPATALWQRLVIEEPQPKALIVGGALFVSGRALSNNPNTPLRLRLVGEDGRILGQRLAGVQIVVPGDYGRFVAQVEYNVPEITPALLVIFEEGGPMSEIAHLSSVPVLLAP